MFKINNILICFVLLSAVVGQHPNSTSSAAVKSTTAKPFQDILSKFHQNDYKFAYERCELDHYNKCFGEFHIRTYKYNRTSPVVNGSFILNVNLGYDVEIIGQLYKFASNEYRIFPLRCEINLCEAMATSAMGFDKLVKQGNLLCPLVKGKEYYYYNFAPDEKNLPPFIPSGQYKLELQYLYHNQELLVTHDYGTIFRPIGKH